MRRPLVFALMSVAASACYAAGCDKKEYAEYKDMARTPAGQLTLAGDYCRWRNYQTSTFELSDLEMKAGRLQGAQRALAESDTCGAEMSKISSALIAAKASKGLTYITKTCGTGK